MNDAANSDARFMTANRSVRTGLTASAVVSGWLWSTAMLGSTLVGYTGGIAGPFCKAPLNDQFAQKSLIHSVFNRVRCWLFSHDCLFRSSRNQL